MLLLTAALLPPVPRRSLAAARAAALRAAATDGELPPPAEADPTAAFFEEGSPYELDLNVLQEVSRRMKASGRPPQQLTAALTVRLHRRASLLGARTRPSQAATRV